VLVKLLIITAGEVVEGTTVEGLNCAPFGDVGGAEHEREGEDGVEQYC
jgi:hypothetical protein